MVIILLILIKIYDTIDITYSLYMLYKSCKILKYIYAIDIIRDLLICTFTVLMFKAI